MTKDWGGAGWHQRSTTVCTDSAHSPKIALHSHAGSNTWYVLEWNYISCLIIAIFHHAGDVWCYRDKKTVKCVEVLIFSLQKIQILPSARGHNTSDVVPQDPLEMTRGPVKIAGISAHCGKNVFFRLSTGKKKKKSLGVNAQKRWNVWKAILKEWQSNRWEPQDGNQSSPEQKEVRVPANI